MDMKERIEQIMEREQMVASTFAESIGIQRSTLAHILSGRNNPSLDVIMKIHQHFKYINLEWLIYGTGPMTDQNEQSNDPYLHFDSSSEPNAHGLTLDLNSSEEDEKDSEANNMNKSQTHEIERIKYIEKPQRKITEIRIFYDDNTFENFKPEK